VSEVLEQAFAATEKSSWQIKTLGEVCRTSSGGTPSRSRPEYFNGSIPWVKSGELTDGLVSEVSEFISEEALAGSSAKLLPAGTLLIAMYGATVGKLGVLTRAAATNQAVCAIFPSPELDPKFLFWYLRRQRSNLIAKAVGGAQPNISQTILRDLELPIPPLDVQREIVAEIEKQFSRLDEAVANLQRVKANLKRYKAAVLKAAVEGRLVETAGRWSSVVLGDIALSVRNGCSVKPDADSGTRILRISAVRPLELDAQDVRFLPGNLEDYAPFDIRSGDVLFTRYNGSRDYVGVCAVVPERMSPTIYPDKLIRVRVDKEKVLPEFLAIACSAGEGRDFIKSKIRTTAGQSGVSGSDIKSIPMRVLSVGAQEVIVAEVDRRLSVLRYVEAEVNANILRAQALRQATLARAFTRED
jgi:type I restriction enzyme, S subunit